MTDLPSPVEILEDRHANGNLDEFREKQESELQHIAHLDIRFDLSVIKLDSLVDRPILEEDSSTENYPPSCCW